MAAQEHNNLQSYPGFDPRPVDMSKIIGSLPQPKMLGEELVRLRAQNHDLQQQVQKLQQQRKVLRKGITHLNAMHCEDLRLAKLHHDREAAYEGNYADLLETNAAIGAELDRYKSSNTSNVNQVGRLQARVRDLETQIESLQNQGSSNARTERMQQQIDQLKATVHALTEPK